MNLKIILVGFLLAAFIFDGCANDKSRKDHKWSSKICNNLYTETFTIFGQGAFGGDRDARWLTDSTNFRIFLGVFDESHGKISVECKGDSILVTQFPDDLDVNENIKSPITKSYQLRHLKELHNLTNF